jgi:negative regulator of sigma E activity
MATRGAAMTEPFDDATLEQLNAYLDGEMADGARSSFEERLAREPDLRALLNQMQTLDTQMTSGLGEPPQASPSEALMAAVRSFSAAQAAEAPFETAKVVDFTPRQGPAPAANDTWRIPFAAAIALCVGAGGMWLVQQQPGQPVQMAAVALSDGVVVPTSALHAALEETQSGSVLASAVAKVRPVLSFASKDGRFCREFEAIGANGSVVGVACKGDTGWKMEVMLSAAPHSPDEMQYAPASGFNAKALDDVVSQLMDGESLTPSAEKSAKDQGWRKRN